MLLYGGIVFQGSLISNGVRMMYTALFAYAMEYVARYNHLYLWHSKYLWWLHGSHHHQYPAVGSTPSYDHKNKYVSPAIELNDIFPVFFATIAVYLISAGSVYPSSLAKDCWTGIALGATIFGLSYFTGHDIVAHERAGKRVAKFLRSLSPYLDKCADVHFKYHHKLTKHDDDRDPYGPPYGFWLGPYEVECLKRGQEYAPMPPVLSFALKGAMLICLGATFILIF